MITKIAFLQHSYLPYGEVVTTDQGEVSCQFSGTLRWYEDGDAEVFARQEVLTDGVDYYDSKTHRKVRLLPMDIVESAGCY